MDGVFYTENIFGSERGAAGLLATTEDRDLGLGMLRMYGIRMPLWTRIAEACRGLTIDVTSHNTAG